MLTSAEADRFVAAAEQMGFRPESPISLPRSVRHNDNLNWVVSDAIERELWGRSAAHLHDKVGKTIARGLNNRFRFYRYSGGDYFAPHTDGAWPGSRVVDGTLIRDAHPGWYSQYTYLVFLTDDFDGGETQFYVSQSNPSRPARREDDVEVTTVRTPKGAVLCFPHGPHPLHCVHSSAPIHRGTKYIIRTDVLYGGPDTGGAS